MIVTASDFAVVISTANNHPGDNHCSRSEEPIAYMMKLAHNLLLLAATSCLFFDVFTGQHKDIMHVNILANKGVRRACLAFIKWQINDSL